MEAKYKSRIASLLPLPPLGKIMSSLSNLPEVQKESIFNLLLLSLALDGIPEKTTAKSNPLETQASLSETISFLKDWYNESINFRSEIERVFKEIFSELISPKKAMMIFNEWLFSYNHLRNRPSFLIAARLLYAGAIYRKLISDNERRKFILVTFSKEESDIFEYLLTIV